VVAGIAVQKNDEKFCEQSVGYLVSTFFGAVAKIAEKKDDEKFYAQPVGRNGSTFFKVVAEIATQKNDEEFCDQSSDAETLALAVSDAELKDYYGGFIDGTHSYTIPSDSGARIEIVTRLAMLSFSDAEVLALAVFDAGLKGYYGGFIDSSHGYTIPYDNSARTERITRFATSISSALKVLDLVRGAKCERVAIFAGSSFSESFRR